MNISRPFIGRLCNATRQTTQTRLFSQLPLKPQFSALKPIQISKPQARLFSSGKPSGSSFRRQVQQLPVERPNEYAEGNPVDWTKVATSVGIATVGAVGINWILNRDTRGSLSAFESEYLNETFRWTAGGLAITALVAKGLHASGQASRLMMMNPWLVMGGGLAASIASMMAVRYTEPGTAGHVLSWGIFSALQGVTLSPLFYISPILISRAGLYTLGAVGGLSYVGATAQSEQYLYLGGPLTALLFVAIISSLAPMVLPRMSLRTMSVLEHVSAYGGVAIFSGFILYDTQKIIKHATYVERGMMKRDTVQESVSLILDCINMFVRILQVLMLQQKNKK